MKRSTLWPIGIATILLTTVAVNFALMYVAGDDPSFAIEPNYYAKAVAWDSTMAQSARNEHLGWRVVPALAPFSTNGGAVLSVSVFDSTGAPIDDATVKVAALYNGRANVVLESTLRHADSAYRGSLPVTHRGQWELRFDVTRGSDRFTSTARIEAAESTSGPRT